MLRLSHSLCPRSWHRRTALLARVQQSFSSDKGDGSESSSSPPNFGQRPIKDLLEDAANLDAERELREDQVAFQSQAYPEKISENASKEHM